MDIFTSILFAAWMCSPTDCPPQVQQAIECADYINDAYGDPPAHLIIECFLSGSDAQ